MSIHVSLDLCMKNKTWL